MKKTPKVRKDIPEHEMLVTQRAAMRIVEKIVAPVPDTTADSYDREKFVLTILQALAACRKFDISESQRLWAKYPNTYNTLFEPHEMVASVISGRAFRNLPLEPDFPIASGGGELLCAFAAAAIAAEHARCVSGDSDWPLYFDDGAEDALRILEPLTSPVKSGQ